MANVPSKEPESASLEDGIKQAVSLLTDMDNEEYIRGMCELLASMYPGCDGDGTEERATSIMTEVARRVEADQARTLYKIRQHTQTLGRAARPVRPRT